MKAKVLYNQLEKDFVTPKIKEDWYEYMNTRSDYICENFKQRSMGLLCDFATEIEKIYTAVFPSTKVLEKILDDKICDSMLFLHHPLDWDLGKNPNNPFIEINPQLLEKFKERRISLFNFHYPLDNFGEYSTSKTLAEAIGIKIEKPFHECGGALCGVIGTTDCADIHKLNVKYSQAVGHETRLYQYGESKIIGNRVAVVAGGGNDCDSVNDVISEGVNILVTGVSLKNKFTQSAHEAEKENGINLLGGTHYSSEKFACIAICKYFQKLGLPAEFIEDSPCLEDL
jgi:putative NIF3 family GTP cyclohydrolase 1 type 2